MSPASLLEDDLEDTLMNHLGSTATIIASTWQTGTDWDAKPQMLVRGVSPPIQIGPSHLPTSRNGASRADEPTNNPSILL